MGKKMSFDQFWQSMKDKDVKGVYQAAETVSNIILSLIEARNAKGFTQRDLADKSGIKQSAIARMESLQAVPRIDTLAKLAHFLDVNITLQSNQPEEVSVVDNSESESTQEQQIFMFRFDSQSISYKGKESMIRESELKYNTHPEYRGILETDDNDENNMAS